MAEWTDVLSVGDFTSEYVVADVDDVSVIVFKINDEFFALENVCTHDGSEIAGGCVSDYEIQCPRHGARFCIKTGEVTAPPAYESIDVFPTRVVDGMVQVRDPRWD